MGERDLGRALPAPPAVPWASRAALAAGLAAHQVLVLVGSPPAAAGAGDYLAARPLAALLGALAPERAPALLGLLALAVAAVVASAALERRLGGAAPPLVLLLVFGSGVWAVVWTAGGELVGLALAVAAFALAHGGGGAAEPPGEIYQGPESGARGWLRWLVVGLLLAGLVPAAPLLAGLVVAAALAVPAGRRRTGLTALALGWLAGLAVEVVVRGPDELLAPLTGAVEAFRFSPALAGWNLLYLAVGRHVGLLAGFAPLLLLATLGLGGKRGLTTVCLVTAAAGAIARPFDFAAGWLNLGFVPLYGALWLLPARPPRRWEWVVTVLICGLFTWPLWLPPWAAADGEARPAAAFPRHYLPYETTLRELPEAGQGDLGRADLVARAVRGCRLVGQPDRFELAGSGEAELYLAAPAGLELAALEFGPGAGTTLEVGGAEAGRTVFRPDGRIGFELRLTRPRARHPLWLGDRPYAVHLVTLRMPARETAGPLRFRLLVPQS